VAAGPGQGRPVDGDHDAARHARSEGHLGAGAHYLFEGTHHCRPPPALRVRPLQHVVIATGRNDFPKAGIQFRRVAAEWDPRLREDDVNLNFRFPFSDFRFLRVHQFAQIKNGHPKVAILIAAGSAEALPDRQITSCRPCRPCRPYHPCRPCRRQLPCLPAVRTPWHR
jgi:hypothetical protein